MTESLDEYFLEVRVALQLYLTAQEEKELTTFLCRAAAIGYGRMRSEVIAIVERILSSRGIYKKVSSGWWESFVKRNL